MIRYAIDTDIPQMIPLLDQLGYPADTQLLSERLRLYAAPEHYAVLVAELEGKVVGFVALAFTELFVSSGKRCRIESHVVDSAYRRKGIGRALVEHAERLAIERGCLGVELTASARREREGVNDFYRALGYDNDGAWQQLYLRKEL